MAMKISVLLRFALVVVMFLFALQPAQSQERATIVGTVTDPSGAVVPNAQIQVANEATGVTQTLATNASGQYRAANLSPGSYRITAQHAGFRTRTFTNFVVRVGQVARLDIVLEIGDVTELVEVVAGAPLLQTDDASVGQVLSPEPIEALPLNGRNFAQLAILSPGMSGLDYAQSNTINSGQRPDELRPGGTTIQANGVSNLFNQMSIDGIDATEMISQTFVVRPTVESIQEFNVLTNNYGAEFGRGAGAVVVINTKSGGNEYHGSVFEFLRNAELDAKNFFDDPDREIPKFIQNQFGASLGGPIRRNKAFFFADWEGFRERRGATEVWTVPTMAMRTGDFSGAAPNGIFDPLSTRIDPDTGEALRDRFAGDRIPASRFDPISAELLNLYPAPQNDRPTRNIVVNPVKESDIDRVTGRYDQVISDKNTLFARYSIDYSRLTIPDTFNDEIGGSESSFAGNNDVRGDSLAIGDTHTFSPTVVGDFRFGYTRFDSELLPTELTHPIWDQIPGRDESDPFQPSAPVINPNFGAGFAGLGNARSVPLIRFQNMTEFKGDLTWVKGKHSIKFGAGLRRRLTSETASPPGENAFGRFNFTSAFTQNPAATAGTGHVFGSMALGFPSRTTRDFFIAETARLNTQEFNTYVQDEWRATNRLTVNLGVHYEVDTPFEEQDNKWANFDPDTASLLIAGQNGVDEKANIDTDLDNFGPRIGFAYQLNEKTVIRSGYGIFFAPQGHFATSIRQFRQAPFDLVFSIIPGDLFPDNRISEGVPGREDFPNVTAENPIGNLRNVQEDLENAEVQQFNFTIEREITPTSVFTLSYVGSLGRKLQWITPLNTPTPGPGSITERRPFHAALPDVVSIRSVQSAANSSYNGLQLSFEKRMSQGLFVLANYTYSKGLSNGGDIDGGSNGPLPQDFLDRRADWGPMNSDIRHRANFSWSYELPFGPGKPFANSNSIGSWLVRDWKISSITVLQTGHPFTVTAVGSPTNTGRGARADVVPGVNAELEDPSLERFFNPDAFAIPSPFNHGNASRNLLFGPDAVNFDFVVSRRFPITEGTTLVFRSEFFNAFNHPQFDLPVSTIGNPSAGEINSTARDSRQIQFALKLLF